MALRIIDDTETQEIDIGGATFLYAVAGWGELKDIRTRCREEGALYVDPEKYHAELLKLHVRGWRGVVRADGSDLPFDAKTLLKLPWRILGPLVDAICESAKSEDQSQGNSPGSSST